MEPWQGGLSKVQLGVANQQSGEIEQDFQAICRSSKPRRIDKLEATLSQTIKDDAADLATVAQQVK